MKNDFTVWRKALADHSRITLVSYPGLSHLFMPAGDPPSPADYAKPGHVSPHVIDSIAGWISQH